jgi:hypothetical protein
MSANPQEEMNRLNLQLPNQAAKKQLLAVKVKLEPDRLYLLQLMRWGYNKGLLEDDPPKRPLHDLSVLLEGLEYFTDPKVVMEILCEEGPDPGAPEAKWIDPHILAELDPEGTAIYALTQAQDMKEDRRQPDLD